ncbi:hypothetical protein JYQ62_25280 [Nostoc sp. UHCC 0702]|nr:hypothetical protein JYQ62_25280 [Nostoc sp. UHCC 0702]
MIKFAQLFILSSTNPDLENKTMAKIVISDLQPVDTNTCLQDLTSVEMDTISGGDDQSLGNIIDSVNQLSKAYTLFTLGNNKIFSVDFSGLTINLISLT